jgi:hypothetical protein
MGLYQSELPQIDHGAGDEAWNAYQSFDQGRRQRGGMSPAAQAALDRLVRLGGGGRNRSLSRGGDGSILATDGPSEGVRQWDGTPIRYAGGSMRVRDNNFGGQNDPAAVALDRAMQATYGMGDKTMDDPRLQAAQEALAKQLDPTQNATNLYSQQTDATAAQAAAQAASMRSLAGSTGLGPQDPAFAAQMRSIESNRMQQNNGALASSQLQANAQSRDAAGMIAQQRLAQIGTAGSFYGQGVGLDSQRRFGTQYQAPQVSMPPGVPQNWQMPQQQQQQQMPQVPQPMPQQPAQPQAQQPARPPQRKPATPATPTWARDPNQDYADGEY